ncbi:hypothetical protein [Nonomuraea sp. NPDC049158]|uniref:hypothetical protein n=1 Tax=Nonomuraea sp. NPDC049158 TaxID=3155649 RepID=UPI0033C02EAC
MPIGIILAFRSGLFSAPIPQVSPAALDDVRRIGIVQAEDSIEDGYDDDVEITNTFVIDVGSTSNKEAIDKTADLLSGRGWEILGKSPTGAAMKSAKWAASLSVDSFDPASLRYHPKILKALQGKSVRAEAFAIVRVNVYQGG